MKRILTLLLCLALILSLTACGGNSAPSKEAAAGGEAGANETLERVVYSDSAVEFTKSELDSARAIEYVKPKNVIVMIGDGMGLNDIAITNKFSDFLFEFGLVIDHLPNIGLACTGSVSGVTDSAAAATALGTGYKAKNGRIGLSEDLQPVKNAAELAREMGKKVGIVTNDAIYGATPSGFTVHCISRDKTNLLCQRFLEFAPDVLIGGGYGEFIEQINKSKEHLPLLEKVNIAPSQVQWQSTLDADQNRQKPFFGFMITDFDAQDYSLASATDLALQRLENENGFFLMVESATPDRAGHANVIERKVKGVSSFDKAVAVALKYCIKNPDTILIVTSDHETGGVALPEGEYTLSNELFTSDSHTGVDVGVFAIGYGTEYFSGKTVENTDIAKFVHAALKGEKFGG